MDRVTLTDIIIFKLFLPFFNSRNAAITHGVLDLFENGGRQIGMPMDPNDKSVDLIRVPRNERSE